MNRSATIFALSSAPGRAGVAVIRVSGPAVPEILQRMAPPAIAHREAAFRRVRHPISGDELDRAVVLFFAAPNSETGEPVAEFQVHGGPAVIRAVLGALSSLPGCRMAEPGEFARRAFENGKIDIAQAEGLADLVEAETDSQRRQALAQSAGALSRLYDGWRTRRIEATALIEAAIDFADEGDVGTRAVEHGTVIAAALRADIKAHLDDGRRGEILRDGFRIVLAGPPNVGKSSLLNALARREAAIVSEEAGTTRDVIEVRLDLGGLPVIVSDTAGIREAGGGIEREGIRRTLATAAAADLVIWVEDAADPAPPAPDPPLTDAAKALLIIANKADLHWSRGADGGPAAAPTARELSVSALTGDGMARLVARIADEARARLDQGAAAGPLLTQARHRQLVEACATALERCLAGNPAEPELRAEDLREAANALGRITGRIDPEHVLDQVFARFCIGK